VAYADIQQLPFLQKWKGIPERETEPLEWRNLGVLTIARIIGISDLNSGL
jgi:hypothetical protein